MAIPHSELQDKYMQLSAPLTDDEVEWRLDSRVDKKKGFPQRARVVPYIKQEVVTSRLNNILGFGNWSFSIERTAEVSLKVEQYADKKKLGYDNYVDAAITETTFDALIIAKLTIHTSERDVVLTDGANDSDSGGMKGSISRAMPRVARLLNMGDELYNIGNVYVQVKNEYGDFDAPLLSQYIKHPAQPAPQAQPNVRPMTPTPPPVDTPPDDFLDGIEESNGDKPITTGAAQKLAMKFDETYGDKTAGKQQRQMLLTIMTRRKIDSATQLTLTEGNRANHLIGFEKRGRATFQTNWEMAREAVAIYASNGATNELWELSFEQIKPTTYDKLKELKPANVQEFYTEQLAKFPQFKFQEAS